MIFNLRLSTWEQDMVAQAAERASVTRSEWVRAAINAKLKADGEGANGIEDMLDDWEDFGSAVVTAHKALLTSLIEQIGDLEWQTSVEGLYAAFRAKTIEKSRTYQAPAIHSGDGVDGEPYVSSVIGFAADDIHEINVSLEQLFFEYCWFAGDERFNAIPAIWARAKARIEAGEPDPTWEQMRAVRNIRRPSYSDKHKA